MSIIEQQRTLESFGEDALVREAQQPSGQYPLFLVISEIERRRDLRARYAAEQEAAQHLGKPPVAEARVNEMAGIPSVDPNAGQQPPPVMGGIAGQPPPPAPPMQGGVAGYQHGGVIDDQERRARLEAIRRARAGESDSIVVRGPDGNLYALPRGQSMPTAPYSPYSRRLPGRLPEAAPMSPPGPGARQMDLSGMDFFPPGGLEDIGYPTTMIPPPEPGPRAVIGRRRQRPSGPDWSWAEDPFRAPNDFSTSMLESQRGIMSAIPEGMGFRDARGQGQGDDSRTDIASLPPEMLAALGDQERLDPYAVMAERMRSVRGAIGLPDMEDFTIGVDYGDAWSRLDALEAGIRADKAAVGDREDVAAARDYAAAAKERAKKMAAMYEAQVEENPTGLEAELQAMRKTPEQIKSEKKALILSGLGSLIGSARNMGDIPAGMKPLADELYGLTQTQRAEDLDLATKQDLLRRTREDRNVANRVAASTVLENADAIGMEASQYIMGLVDRYDDQLRGVAELAVGLAGDEATARVNAQQAEGYVKAQWAQALTDVARVTASTGMAKAVDPVEQRLEIVKIVGELAQSFAEATGEQPATFMPLIQSAVTDIAEMMGYDGNDLAIDAVDFIRERMR